MAAMSSPSTMAIASGVPRSASAFVYAGNLTDGLHDLARALGSDEDVGPDFQRLPPSIDGRSGKMPDLREWARLAVGAEVRAPAAHFDASYLRAANIARLPRATKDLHPQLVRPLAAGGVDVVAEGGAAIAQGVVEDASDGAVESLHFRFGQRVGEPLRMDAGGEEGLVGVDVADAGDSALVEEDGLDGRASVRERLLQLRGGERGVERLRAEGADGLFGRIDEPHLAELAEVGVAQLEPSSRAMTART